MQNANEWGSSLLVIFRGVYMGALIVHSFPMHDNGTQVLRGYVGDRSSRPVWGGRQPFDVLGTGYQRPFELATLRLNHMVNILPRCASPVLHTIKVPCGIPSMPLPTFDAITPQICHQPISTNARHYGALNACEGLWCGAQAG